MKTQTTTKPSAKNSKNTPVIASFDTYIAKVADPKKAEALKAAKVKADATKAAKVVKAEEKKTGIFALVAGTVAKIKNKHMKKAIAYHVSKGNLAKTTAGIKLTEQGAMLWNAERVAADPEKFQAIASMLHAKGEVIPEWKRQPVAKASESIVFPNMLYWGSFSSGIMRQAFAALWAK